jgi:hypothetical protein
VHAEHAHTYPAPLKKGFDYISDFHTWPLWYVGITELIDPERCRWSQPGDEVRYRYKILGRHIDATSILDESIDLERKAFRTVSSGFPEVHWEYRYAAAGQEAFILRVVMETEEPTSFFGRTVDRMLLPRIVERDAKRSLENLHDIFVADLA